MTLPELASLYLGGRLGLTAQYRDSVLSIARRCAAELSPPNGQPTTSAGLCGWLQSCLDAGRAPASVAHYRRILLALLRFGAARGLCRPVDLPPIRVPMATPEAWTAGEVAAIVRTAARLPGQVGARPAAAWWQALVLCVYWTGARIGSVLAAAATDWDPAASILILRRTKNGRAAAHRLHPQAAGAVERICDPGAARLFVWPGSRWTLFRVFRRIVESAGVPCPRGERFGLFHRLRRTTLSYCWAADPAIAQRQADHSTAALTRDRYVDPRIVGAAAVSAADVLPVLEI